MAPEGYAPPQSDPMEALLSDPELVAKLKALL